MKPSLKIDAMARKKCKNCYKSTNINWHEAWSEPNIANSFIQEAILDYLDEKDEDN